MTQSRFATNRYSPHFEVYLKMKQIGWIMAGFRDEEAEAEAFGNREVKADSNVIDFKIKKKTYAEPIRL